MIELIEKVAKFSSFSLIFVKFMKTSGVDADSIVLKSFLDKVQKRKLWSRGCYSQKHRKAILPTFLK
jgi:hypothetical protein